MKIKITLLLVIILVVLSGCLNKDKNVTEPLLTLEKVKAGLQSDGIEMFPIQISNDDLSLNKVKPDNFTVGRPLEDVAQLEQISIYIFDSEDSRILGRKDFDRFLEFSKLATTPNVYGQKNILIIYWKNSSNNKFGEQIDKVLTNL